MKPTLENEYFCPNCGYQVKPEEYYCPSCRHRIDLPLEEAPRTSFAEPIAEKVQIAKALVLSSVIYISSIVMSTFQFVLLSMNVNYPANAVSSIAVIATLVAGVAAFYLAGGIYTTIKTLKILHYPALLIFILGIANILLATALMLIFPSSSTLNSILTQLGTTGNVTQIAGKYATFFLLVGLASFLGIIGIAGFLIAINRISRILEDSTIRYGLIVAVIFALIEILTGFPLLMVVPPILFIIGAKRSILT